MYLAFTGVQGPWEHKRRLQAGHHQNAAAHTPPSLKHGGEDVSLWTE